MSPLSFLSWGVTLACNNPLGGYDGPTGVTMTYRYPVVRCSGFPSVMVTYSNLMGVPAVSNGPTGVMVTYINPVGVSAVCGGPMVTSNDPVGVRVASNDPLGVTLACSGSRLHRPPEA
jgi:hypothetical protein